jgi:recombination DNA repair RAD52 pathway protein
MFSCDHCSFTTKYKNSLKKHLKKKKKCYQVDNDNQNQGETVNEIVNNNTTVLEPRGGRMKSDEDESQSDQRNDNKLVIMNNEQHDHLLKTIIEVYDKNFEDNISKLNLSPDDKIKANLQVINTISKNAYIYIVLRDSLSGLLLKEPEE